MKKTNRHQKQQDETQKPPKRKENLSFLKLLKFELFVYIYLVLYTMKMVSNNV